MFQEGIYVVVDPIHTNMVLQVAELDYNMLIKNLYEREYAASICRSMQLEIVSMTLIEFFVPFGE